MVASKKDRTHSGRVTIYFDDEDYPYLETFYDEWENYRDSQRDKTNLRKKIYLGMFGMNEIEYWKLRNKINKIRTYEIIRRLRQKKKDLKS